MSRVLRTTATLSRNAERIVAGDYAVRVTIHGPAVMRRLAGLMNSIAVDLMLKFNYIVIHVSESYEFQELSIRTWLVTSVA